MEVLQSHDVDTDFVTPRTEDTLYGSLALQEGKRLEQMWLPCFQDVNLEIAFVRRFVSRRVKNVSMRWFLLSLFVFLVCFVPWYAQYASSDWLADGQAIASTRFMMCCHVSQLFPLHGFLIVRFVETHVCETDVLVLLVSTLWCLSVAVSNDWRAGTWYADDGCLFWRSKWDQHCPHVDINDINYILILSVVFQFVISFGLRIRARLGVIYVAVAPTTYFVTSFPENWSPHSRWHVIAYTTSMFAFAFFGWICHLRQECHDRLEWLRLGALKKKANLLVERAETRHASSELKLALQELDSAIRWQSSDDHDSAELSSARQFLMEQGWTLDQVDAKVRAIRKDHSETFGVCANYLLSVEFTMFAQHSTGEDDPNFYQIGTAIFYGDTAIGKGSCCPRDGAQGCSFLDVLAPKDKGPCTHFLSWSWSYPLSDVQGALRTWIEKGSKDPSDIYLWMCFFVNNQHRILNQETKTMDGSDNLDEVFAKSLLRIRSVVILFDDWNASTYLTRIWCIFEQYTAIKEEIEVEMILPPASVESFLKQIELGKQGILNLKDQLSKVNSKNAKAAVPADERRVKDMIEECGFDKVDRRITESLVKWMASEVHDYMTKVIYNTELSVTKHRLLL